MIMLPFLMLATCVFSCRYEEGLKKYIELRYHMEDRLFHIVLNKTVALKEVKIAGPSPTVLPERNSGGGLFCVNANFLPSATFSSIPLHCAVEIQTCARRN